MEGKGSLSWNQEWKFEVVCHHENTKLLFFFQAHQAIATHSAMVLQAEETCKKSRNTTIIDNCAEDSGKFLLRSIAF